MRKFFLGEILDPIFRRLGTAASAYLIGIGVQAETVNLIVTGMLAAAGLSVDLMLSHKARAK